MTTEKEKELDEIVEKVRNENTIKFPPIFEMFITLFSISTSVVMFSFPNMMQSDADLYDWMLKIIPQYLWAFCFFGSGLIKSVGLLLDKDYLRVIGLIASAVLYLILTICYAINFPTIGSVYFGCMTIFTIVSINIVKHTGIER